MTSLSAMTAISQEAGDPLCRFYTRPTVSALLVSLMGNSPPLTVLDLASGAGALSLAARDRWKDVPLTTVDIDAALSARSLSLSSHHRHVVADALDENLPYLLCREGAGFDLTLCNPPYKMPAWRPGFERILADAGLAAAFTRQDTSAEALFVAQNLRLTRVGGRIGLIVPDGLITGRRSEAFRKTILSDHGVDCAVQLPPGAFLGTEARAFILILRKGCPGSRNVTLHRLDRDGSREPLSIAVDAGIQRLDYDFHALSRLARGASLATLGAAITRGSLEAAPLRSATFPVFHTSHFPAGERRRNHHLHWAFQPASLPPGRSLILAEPGDILIARVDRRLERKVCGISTGRAALSSSVLRIRLPGEVRDAALDALLSSAGQQSLAATANGVGARMLSKDMLLRMPLPM